MSAFDLMNQSLQCTEPEVDCITPLMKLRDEVFVFIDGKWVNEIYCQPPFASGWKPFSKRAQNEWSIWEENTALWEENQVLQRENRMLWEENKALPCLQSQNEAVPVIYTDNIQESFQKEKKAFPFFQERKRGFQVNPGHKALQVDKEKNRVFLEDLQQKNKTVPIIWKDQKTITIYEESKDASSDLQKDTDTITAMEECNPDPAPWQEDEAKMKTITSTQNKIKSAPSMQGKYEILQALQDLYEFFHIFLNNLLGEKQGSHIPYDVNRSFQEDYDKLKLQLNTVKNTVSDIRAHMEMLEKALIDITSPMYEKAEQKLASEHQLGEM